MNREDLFNFLLTLVLLAASIAVVVGSLIVTIRAEAGVFVAVPSAGGAAVACTVNFADTEAYQKPPCYAVTLPPTTNEYYVDMDAGSGTTCSEVSPCANISDVYGKAGTTGGPAYIYVKGTGGQLSLTGTLYGSAGNEIVITHWPGATAAVEWTKTSGGAYTDAHRLDSTNIYHLILDGGENMLFRFFGTTTGTGENDYTFYVSTDNTIVRRVRIDGTDDEGPCVGMATGAGSYDSITLLNSELFECGLYGIYTGGGTICTANNTEHDNLLIKGNVFYNVHSQGIEINPRSSTASTNNIVEANAFHDIADGALRTTVGNTSCGSGVITGTIFRNNLIFDVGGGCFNNYTGNTLEVYNNTCWNYHSKGYAATLESHGITCYTDGCPIDAKNNILLGAAGAGTNNCNRTSGWTTNDNVNDDSTCGTGQIAGTAANTFASTANTGTDHLKIKSGSPAEDAGVNLYTDGVTIDYFGSDRVNTGTFDIGAHKYD